MVVSRVTELDIWWLRFLCSSRKGFVNNAPGTHILALWLRVFNTPEFQISNLKSISENDKERKRLLWIKQTIEARFFLSVKTGSTACMEFNKLTNFFELQILFLYIMRITLNENVWKDTPHIFPVQQSIQQMWMNECESYKHTFSVITYTITNIAW